MKKSAALFLSALMTLALACGATAGDSVRISATKKTARKQTGDTVKIPYGQGHATDKSIYYEFTLKAVTPNVASPLTVEWAVLLERPDGKIDKAASGSKEVALKFGQTVTVESDPVSLRSIEWTHGGGKGKVADDVYGYVVLLKDPQGIIVAEEFQPASAKKDLAWLESERERRDAEIKDKIGKFLRAGEKKPKPPPAAPR